MIEHRKDFAFLRQFAREGDQSAFGALMRRHLDLVFGTALRKVGDEGAAQEVAQNVFMALARKAWRFSPEDSIPAWLHRTTVLESKQWLRGELRRRRREQTAAQLGTTMKTPDEQPAIRALMPLLDEALLSLREKDRTALLLRFYEQRSLREVGNSIGVGEDAAQKRVASAVDRLVLFFQRRGFRTAGSAVAVAALKQAVSAAPASVANSVVQGVLHSAPPAVSGLTALLARMVALPKAQAAVLCLVLAAAPASLEWSRASAATKKVSRLQSTVDSMEQQNQQAMEQTDRLRARLPGVADFGTPVAGAAIDNHEEAARNFAGLKMRVSNLLTTSDYHWPDDLPFVRVPKSALRNMSSDVPAFGPKGRLSQWIQEVLNLSEQQRTDLEANLAQHLGAMDRLVASRATATNWMAADGSYHAAVSVPPLGEDGQYLENVLSANLANMLGPEQAKLVLSPFSSPNQWLSEEKVSHFLIKEKGRFELSVKPLDSGMPYVSMTWDGHISSGGPIQEGSLPPFLEETFLPWLERNGLTNGIFRSKP
jgi:RNA polymerase sigma factor (sigma-70 family)